MPAKKAQLQTWGISEKSMGFLKHKRRPHLPKGKREILVNVSCFHKVDSAFFYFLNPYIFTLKNFLPDILNNFSRLRQYIFSLSHRYCSRKHRQLSCYLFLIFPAGRNNVFYKPFHFYRNQAMNAALSKEKYSQIIFSLR